MMTNFILEMFNDRENYLGLVASLLMALLFGMFLLSRSVLWVFFIVVCLTMLYFLLRIIYNKKTKKENKGAGIVDNLENFDFDGLLKNFDKENKK